VKPAPPKQPPAERLWQAIRDYFVGEDPSFWVAMVPMLALSGILYTRHPATNCIFDEQEALLANPYVHGKSLGWLDAFHRDFWGLPPDRSVGSYRPIPDLLWRAVYRVAENPWLAHWINVLLHAANGALFVVLVFGWTKRRGTAWLAGAIFTGCAVLTEAVSGVVGIADVLGGMGALFALWALSLPLWGMPFAVAAALLFGLFSKESALVCVPLVPFAALLLAPVTHPSKPLRVLRSAFALVATVGAFYVYVELRKKLFPAPMESSLNDPLPDGAGFLAHKARAFLVWFHQPPLPKDPLNNPLIHADTPHRIAGALRVYWRGLTQLVVPVTLSGDYSYPQEPIPERVVFPESVLGAAMMVLPPLASVVLWVRALVRERRFHRDEPAAPLPYGDVSAILVAVGLTWIVVSYFPHSNIPVLLPTVRAERFLYFPALGSTLVLTAFFTWAFRRTYKWEQGAYAVGLFALFFTFQCGKAYQHSRDYRDDLRFWDATRHAVPRSAKAHLNYSVMQGARGRLDLREESNRVALELAPEWPMAHIYLGDTLCRMHKVEEAWPYYKSGFPLADNDPNLLSLGLQCLWDEHETNEAGESVSGFHQHEQSLQTMANAHPGSWLAFLVNDMVSNGEKNNGVDTKYRPRGYNEGPKELDRNDPRESRVRSRVVVARISLTRAFVLATAAVTLVVAVSFTLSLRASRRSILESANRRRVAEAHRVEEKVLRELSHASNAVEALDRGFRAGSIEGPGRVDVEPDLFNALSDEALEEATFTHALSTGYAADGEATLLPDAHYQVSVYRTSTGAIETRRTVRATSGEYVATIVRHETGAPFDATKVVGTTPNVKDPTLHPTFTVLASKEQRGRAVWSDLHRSEIDQSLPPAERRVVLTLQKATFDAAGEFVGVRRVGLSTKQIDAITNVQMDDAGAEEPYRVALLSVDLGPPVTAHLVSRVHASDQLASFGDDLRFVTTHAPPELAAVLASPLLSSLDPEHPSADGAVVANGERYLVTLRELTLGDGGTTGWFAAIVVPESRYTAELLRFQSMFLYASGITLALVLLIASLMLGSIRRGLRRLGASTARMRDFDFAKGHETSVVRDIDEVLEGLERAKTVARAMGRYVPLELVRNLYRKNEEPSLGGASQELTLMFTDIEGFTSLSETLPPDELAQRLGDYLATMTEAIEKTGGTIDKYIGDAIMALWNAPIATPDHAARACRAALACLHAGAKLYASPRWSGLPALVTRFGIHTTTALVGNFGAPTRLSYTALGDGVNLAARLEPLCKQYGVVMLVSEDIVRLAGDSFLYRKMDRVAVKGKTRGIEVYELLGESGDTLPALPTMRRYEAALDLYFARRFDEAIELLEPQAAQDFASGVLLSRCRHLREDPPPPSWDGVHVAKSK
jgi:adenylate cyclase